MKVRPVAEELGEERGAASKQDDANVEDPYATTYTPEEDNTLFYGRIFLTELRTTPPVAVDLSQPPQEHEHLLRFPVSQAVRLFDDADGNARWLSEDALYTHERVIQQDRVRLHPAAEPIETMLQRVEDARNAGTQPYLEGVSSYLRDAPAIRRPTIEDLLAEIVEDPAGHRMFADLDEEFPDRGAEFSPIAPHFQAVHGNTGYSAPSNGSYSISDAVREGRRTNQHFNQQSVPSEGRVATPVVLQQSSAAHPSLPSLPVNATPLRQVSNANEIDTATNGQPSTRGVERVRSGRVRKSATARQSSAGSSHRSGSPLRQPAVSTNPAGSQLVRSTPNSRTATSGAPAQVRTSNLYSDFADQDAQRPHSGSGNSANDMRTNEHPQASSQMSRLVDVTDPDYEAIIYDSEPEQ